MPFTMVQQDITRMKVDALVNAANPALEMGEGVCGAIFRAAGVPELREACGKVAPIPTGEAAITPGFALSCRYIIHAVGPVYSREEEPECRRLLRSAYLRALCLAEENRCESIAFPLISGGIYGYPKEEALRVAVSAIRDFLSEHDMEVYLALPEKSACAVPGALAEAVGRYVDTFYAEPSDSRRPAPLSGVRSAPPRNAHSSDTPMVLMSVTKASLQPDAGVEELVGRLDEPFSATLLRLIDAKGKTDAEVYRRANIDRRLFSKIRTGRDYTPGKRTILALAIALELNLAETNDLLKRAGYALSHSRSFDVIVEYFIVHGRYDIFEINELLFRYDQPLLGG